MAQRPIGPWAKTTTESPSCTSAVSTAEMPVVAMSVTKRTSSSESPSGIRARLAWAYGTRKYSACTPSIELPSRQPPMIPHWSSNPAHWEKSPAWQK